MYSVCTCGILALLLKSKYMSQCVCAAGKKVRVCFLPPGQTSGGFLWSPKLSQEIIHQLVVSPIQMSWVVPNLLWSPWELPSYTHHAELRKSDQFTKKFWVLICANVELKDHKSFGNPNRGGGGGKFFS